MTDENNNDQDQEQQEQESHPSAEAAKYRTRLREAEQARDAAVAALEDARGEIVRTALTGYQLQVQSPKGYTTSALFKAEAFADAGFDVAGLFDGGKLDAGRLEAAVRDLHESKPYMFGPSNSGNRVPKEGRPVLDSNQTSSEFVAAFGPDRE